MTTTAGIFGLRAMQKGLAEDYADWAVGMLESGSDSKSLRILAGLTKTDSCFEAEEYFRKAISEIGISEPTKEKAFHDYAVYCAERIVDEKIDIRNGVKRLYSLCVEADYPKWLMIWFELDDALDDVFYRNEPYSYPGLTEANMKEKVIEEAKRFIGENK